MGKTVTLGLNGFGSAGVGLESGRAWRGTCKNEVPQRSPLAATRSMSDGTESMDLSQASEESLRMLDDPRWRAAGVWSAYVLIGDPDWALAPEPETKWPLLLAFLGLLVGLPALFLLIRNR